MEYRCDNHSYEISSVQLSIGDDWHKFNYVIRIYGEARSGEEPVSVQRGGSLYNALRRRRSCFPFWRIGSYGHIQYEWYPSPEEAEQERLKRIERKRRRGYEILALSSEAFGCERVPGNAELRCLCGP